MNKKKIGKYLILGTFVIITGIVGVSAANTLSSNGVLYSNAVSSVTTVEGALNELYANYNSLLAKGDATAEQILSGKKVLVKGKEVTGTMPDRTSNTGTSGLAWATSNIEITPHNQLRIGITPGYYGSANYSNFGTSGIVINDFQNKLGITASKILSGQSIAGVSGTATSDATASAGQILNGQTAYVNGSKVTGTMTNWAGTPQHIDAVRLANGRFEVAVARGYHNYSWDGNSYEYLDYSQVANTIGLTADKIAKGQTILGITGTYDRYNSGYNDGVSAADNRTNNNSSSYRDGGINGVKMYTEAINSYNNYMASNSSYVGKVLVVNPGYQTTFQDHFGYFTGSMSNGALDGVISYSGYNFNNNSVGSWNVINWGSAAGGTGRVRVVSTGIATVTATASLGGRYTTYVFLIISI